MKECSELEGLIRPVQTSRLAGESPFRSVAARAKHENAIFNKCRTLNAERCTRTEFELLVQTYDFFSDKCLLSVGTGDRSPLVGKT